MSLYIVATPFTHRDPNVFEFFLVSEDLYFVVIVVMLPMNSIIVKSILKMNKGIRQQIFRIFYA